VSRLGASYFRIDELERITGEPLAELLVVLSKLEEEGFVSMGFSEEEIERKDLPFSYNKRYTKPSLSNKEFFFYTTALRLRPAIIKCRIELTNTCNERCVHCYIPHEEKTSTLPADTVRYVIDELAEMKTLNLILGGGEPLMHPGFCEIYRYAAEKGFHLIVLSNLTLLDERHIGLFKEMGLGYVQTSLYSMDGDTHDRITGVPGSHTKTLDAIKRLYENNIKVKISCPILDINAESVIDVFRWAKAKNIGVHADSSIFAETNLCTENLKHRLPLFEVEQLLEKLIHVFPEFFVENIRKKRKRYSNDYVCEVGTMAVCLSATGDYYPCSGWQGYVIGTVNQHLRDIWNNSSELKTLRNLKESSFPGCLACEAQEFCSMCLVKNFNENGGDIFKPCAFTCQEAFTKKKLFEKCSATDRTVSF
jgi:radical SAM protein with 4Fe4S-binding SPASM domain